MMILCKELAVVRISKMLVDLLVKVFFDFLRETNINLLQFQTYLCLSQELYQYLKEVLCRSRPDVRG